MAIDGPRRQLSFFLPRSALLRLSPWDAGASKQNMYTSLCVTSMASNTDPPKASWPAAARRTPYASLSSAPTGMVQRAA